MAEKQTYNKVLEVVNNYIDGTYHADLDKLSKAFHENAVLTGYLGEIYLNTNTKHFFDDIASRPLMSSVDAVYIPVIKSVDFRGNIATVVLIEYGFGGNIDIENHLQIVNVDGKWAIVSKLFTSFEEGGQNDI